MLLFLRAGNTFDYFHITSISPGSTETTSRPKSSSDLINHMTSSRHQTNLHHSIRIASSKHDKHTPTESTTSLLPARRRTLSIIHPRPSQLTPQRLDSFSLPLPLLSNPPHLLIPKPTTSSLLILSSFLLFFSLFFPLCFLLSHLSCKKCLVVFFGCFAVGTEGVCG